MKRAHNFSAGPAALPSSVLEKVQEELLDYAGLGVSVMEMSHRSKEYGAVYDNAISCLTEILSIPKGYHILFIQGGATAQFSMVPLNLFKKGKADYVNTGVWSKKAIQEARRYGEVRVIASSEKQNFNYIPQLESAEVDPEADYVHITSNNTIYGTEFSSFPKIGNLPLVVDMSSNILSRKIRVEDCALIYGGAQKNIGPSGLGFAIIREDMLGHAHKDAPVLYNYKTYADNGSMYNTPNTFAIYLAGLVFQWIKEQGGVTAIEAINQKKAGLLYSEIDESDFYVGTAEANSRSWMNVTFQLQNTDLEAKFLTQAKEHDMLGLAGHRSVGGIRTSLYNAVTLESVQALVDLMKEFKRTHG